MAQPFLQVAIPVLYVYDADAQPTQPPGFDMNLLPVISRALKQRAGTQQLTVITGTPSLPEDLGEAFTNLALRYRELQKATPEAGNLIAAEFLADHFDAEAVVGHLQRILAERSVKLQGAGGEAEPGDAIPR
ncbi:MAG TPA: hypothetical protein VGR28_04175 [Candidatus Thermoplasmatota archaeon]|jgi:hypothetical protein|nr:hypothetical protein [Candidatus Thermoplasmatota archaeon]